VLQPGDRVEVFGGELAGWCTWCRRFDQQDVVTITAVGIDIDGQKVDVPTHNIHRQFKAGDQVKVLTGLVLSSMFLITWSHFLSDMSMQQVGIHDCTLSYYAHHFTSRSLFSNNLQEAANVGLGANTISNYKLHDLVQLK
jgi:transcription elongation factor SPT5